LLNNHRIFQQGYIYIDVIMGMVILITALTVLAAAYQQSTRHVIAVSNHVIATNLAMETIENLKRYEEANLTRASAEWKTTVTSTINNVPYQVTTAVIEDEHLTTQIATNSRIIPVNVTVTWPPKGNVTITTYYTVIIVEK
jgi:hypothetical protein